MDFKSNELRVTLMTLTVEMAEDIISKTEPDDNYRALKQNVADMYARDMEEGKWMFCGNTVCFSKDGKLINGQHSLRAVIKSKKPQTFVIVMGLEPEAALVMDIGFKRSVEDYLKRQAKAYEKGATAIVKQVEGFKKSDKCMGHSAANIDGRNTKIVDIYSEDEDWYNKAAKYGKEINKSSGKALRPTEVGAIYYYLIRELGVDRNKVEDFFFRLCSAARNDNTIFNTTVRNLTDKDYIGRSGVKRTDEYIQCWNAFIHGCTVKRPRYSDWFEKPSDIRKTESDIEFATKAL